VFLPSKNFKESRFCWQNLMVFHSIFWLLAFDSNIRVALKSLLVKTLWLVVINQDAD
jgi:hypothetical protein